MRSTCIRKKSKSVFDELDIDENIIHININLAKKVKELKNEKPLVQNDIHSNNDYLIVIHVSDVNENDSINNNIFNNDKFKEIVKEPKSINKNELLLIEAEMTEIAFIDVYLIFYWEVINFTEI